MNRAQRLRWIAASGIGVACLAVCMLTLPLAVRYVRRFTALPQRQFANYSELQVGFALIRTVLKDSPQAITNHIDFAMLADVITNTYAAILTNGTSLSSPNPFPGLLPDGNYSRTIALPSSFTASQTPLIWRELYYGYEYKVFGLTWSGESIDTRVSDFDKKLNDLIAKGFPTNLIRSFPRNVAL